MKRWIVALLLVAARSSCAENLLPNGDFEKGQTTPAGWQTIDGLSSFWVKSDDAGHGKVLKFDTGILQLQAYEWWEKILHGALPKDAPRKKPYAGAGYDTLAGFDGVWFYSDPVEVKPGQAYWLTLDVKGPEIMVWLLGYAEKPNTEFGADAAAFRGWIGDKTGTRNPVRGHKMFIHAYDWKGQLKAGGGNEWKTYSRREKPFRPTALTPQVRFVRVLLLPYWPPGDYYVDNVTLTAFEEQPAPAQK